MMGVVGRAWPSLAHAAFGGSGRRCRRRAPPSPVMAMAVSRRSLILKLVGLQLTATAATSAAFAADRGGGPGVLSSVVYPATEAATVASASGTAAAPAAAMDAAELASARALLRAALDARRLGDAHAILTRLIDSFSTDPAWCELCVVPWSMILSTKCRPHSACVIEAPPGASYVWCHGV